ncbi:TetR/AcrR family transcriptional regulator [Nocardia sp. NPDC051900]|uniref:TetR/AcrR family transcriptional regulator n=1 Tax=Nocardia sp. NPDC051900 TaxID=3364326 RepID=UPI0037AF35D5
MSRRATLSTAELRREAVVDAAIDEFARTGYHGTPITSVAARASISPAYVFKLFPGKVSLFVAALDRAFELIEEALSAGASRPGETDPDAILYRMGGAYAELIADNRLLMVQVHAQSAAGIPEIAAAMRNGLERVTAFAAERSGGSAEQVQRFIAYGQLCHLITTLDIDASAGEWAAMLAKGIRHPNRM